MLQCLLHSDYLRNIINQNSNNELFKLLPRREIKAIGLLNSINVRREIEYEIQGNRDTLVQL